jgi:CheY-like chemotaxis protein
MNKNIMDSAYYNTGCEQISYNILLVDDSKTFNQKVSDGLTILGHNITQAYTLLEANNCLKKSNFDFILLDLILPDGEGNELIDVMDKETRSKVIVLSGDNDHQRRSHIFESGILDYFSKSNPTHKIIDDVKKLLCTVQINSKINVLLVDDSYFMRKMLTNILSPKKFNILEAVNGQEGLEVLSETEIHLVILDYEMPIMDGIQFIEKIKQNIDYLDLPIIMLSGNDDKNIVARALKNGASDFLKKPFATEELLLKCDLHVKNYLNIKIIKHKDKELIKSLEKTKEAEQHKSIFLANMSHEIRTPLNAIMGFVDLLAEDEVNNVKKNYLSTIQKSGNMLLNLINDVLDFSKIDNGKLDINKEIFVLDELIDLLINLYSPMIERKGLVLHRSIDKNIVKYINSDFLRIKQVLTNLISNAIKFTPSGGSITIDITLSHNKEAVLFNIIDTGIGIAHKNHQKIFELFSQAEKTTTENFGGTGLGLSISSQLVSLLGGTIGIKSELSKGSCFYFDIPIGDVAYEKITHHEVIQKEKIITTYTQHVLLVEDNITNQKFMEIILSKHKLTFDIASDGNEALELFKKNNYDMIFMDENMPNMNGIESTKLIRIFEKEIKKNYTPIIALTANALIGDEERFKIAGMDEYLSKPLNREKLAEILVKYFDRESVFDMVVQTNDKHLFEKEFLLKVTQPIELIDDAIQNNNFNNIVKYINIVKIISMKYSYQDIFTLCLNIEDSAKDSDIQSCRNFLLVLKGQFNGI